MVHHHGRAVEQLRQMIGGDRFLAGEAGKDADRIAVGLARQHDVEAGGVVFDDVDLIRVGRVIVNYRRARHEHRVLPTGQKHARGGEHAGAKFRLRIVKTRFENEGARIGIDRGIDGRHLAREVAVRERGDPGDHRHANAGAGTALLRGLQLQLHGADTDQRRDLVGERDMLARGHRARGNISVERRVNRSIG